MASIVTHRICAGVYKVIRGTDFYVVSSEIDENDGKTIWYISKNDAELLDAVAIALWEAKQWIAAGSFDAN